jgi:hypothetical protein
MWAKHPEIAQRWVDEGAKSKGLPMHVKKPKKHLFHMYQAAMNRGPK